METQKALIGTVVARNVKAVTPKSCISVEVLSEVATHVLAVLGQLVLVGIVITQSVQPAITKSMIQNKQASVILVGQQIAAGGLSLGHNVTPVMLRNIVQNKQVSV